jgi:hypothetical protein
MLAATSLVGAVDVWGSGTPGIYFVTDFYVHGDGINDDTAAFQGAIDAARDAGGGAVIVPPVGGGKGYVLEGTVTVWQSVALIGSLAGFSSNGWAAYSQSESHVVGAKILARPTEEHGREPLFKLMGGNTVRGFWIFYDKQPWPTDAQFNDPASTFYYPSLKEARDPVAGFIQKKVLACGPTFYVTMGDNTCLEDIICDRYYDFFYLKAGARVSVNRITLYGYKRGFVIEKSYDVNRLSNIELVTGVGPVTLGNDLCYKRDCGANCKCGVMGNCVDCRSYSWMYGIIVAQEDNIGVQIGRSDGYTLTNVFFDAVHTGIRLGASAAWPLWEPVDGRNVDLNYLYPSEDPVGPWGSMSNIGVDGCNVGLQFVMPGGIATHISNLLVYPQFDDGKKFTALYGTGEDLANVSRHAAIIFEDTYTHENYSGGPVPALLISNAEIGSSWPENKAISGVGASMCTANGRVFLVAGEATVEISGLALSLDVGPSVCSKVDPSSLLIAAAAGVGDVSIRVRGYVLNGRPESDWIWPNVLSPWPVPFP